MKRPIIFAAALIAVAVHCAGHARAQQLSVPVAYGVAPSPFAASSYSRGVTQLKMEAEYLVIEGASISLAGGGINGVVRSTFTDLVASSVQVGLFGMRGSSDDIVQPGGQVAPSHSGITLGELLAGVNGELQVFRSRGMSAILLAGPLAELFYGTIETTFSTFVPLSGLSDSGDVMSILYGMQGGGQIGFNLGATRLNLFGLLQNLQGTSRITWSTAGKVTAEVHPVYAANAGIELSIPAWKTMIGAQTQNRPGTNNMRGYRANLWHVSWSF